MAQYNPDFNFVTTTKHFEIGVDTVAGWGYYQHHVEAYKVGGELVFRDKTLTNYDGVYRLPKEVYEALKAGGFDLSRVKDSV